MKRFGRCGHLWTWASDRLAPIEKVRAEAKMDTLDLKTLKKAVPGEYAAIRRVTRMEALGEKIFPPTYEGGEYATEQRQVLNPKDKTVQTVETVLLDSVQSQAN